MPLSNAAEWDSVLGEGGKFCAELFQLYDYHTMSSSLHHQVSVDVVLSGSLPWLLLYHYIDLQSANEAANAVVEAADEKEP